VIPFGVYKCEQAELFFINQTCVDIYSDISLNPIATNVIFVLSFLSYDYFFSGIYRVKERNKLP
jgi:hypothetical protein